MRALPVALIVFAWMLAGCAPGPSASEVPLTYSTKDNPVLLSERLGLEAPPGAGILEVRDGGRRVTAWFTMGVAIGALEAYIEQQLIAAGWLRETFAGAGARSFQADFRRERERVRVYVEQEDWSGRFRLEIR